MIMSKIVKDDYGRPYLVLEEQEGQKVLECLISNSRVTITDWLFAAKNFTTEQTRGAYKCA